MKRPKRCAGSTLVDATAAMAVVAIAIVASAAATIEGSTLGASNEATRATTQIMTSLLEEARSTPFANLTTTFNGVTRTVPFGGNAAGATATFAVTAAGGTTRWPVRQLTVNLSWRTAHEIRTLSSSVLLCNRVGTVL